MRRRRSTPPHSYFSFLFLSMPRGLCAHVTDHTVREQPAGAAIDRLYAATRPNDPPRFPPAAQPLSLALPQSLLYAAASHDSCTTDVELSAMLWIVLRCGAAGGLVGLPATPSELEGDLAPATTMATPSREV